MKNVFKLIGIIAITVVIGLSMAACKEPEPEKEEPEPIKVSGIQVYTLSGSSFTAYSGSGGDVSGYLSGAGDGGASIGKIGVISSDGKLTLEIPVPASDKLYLLPDEFGGNGTAKFANLSFSLSIGNYDSLYLHNSGDVNKTVMFQYFDSDFTASVGSVTLSVKKGWNYNEMAWGEDSDSGPTSMQIITDISSHKWVIFDDN